MKSHTVAAFLVGAMLASSFSIQPCAAAKVSVSSVYYQPAEGSATRQPRTGSGGELVTMPGSSFTPDPNITGPTVPVQTNVNPNIVIGATSYALAYINVSGGAGGGITVFPDANGGTPDFVTVPVQNPPQNIYVENVYFPVGGPGKPCPPNEVCSTGASIDEFSETLGKLIDDTFVNVFSPPASTTADATLTKTANVDGAVDTTEDSVRIKALNPPVAYHSATTGGVFDKWVSRPGGTIGSDKQDLGVNKQADDYALALYRSECPAGYYWNPSATISQCSREPTCTIPGEIFNPLLNKCTPGCPPEEVCNQCPQCKYGCGPVEEKEGTVWVCFAHKLGTP